MKKRRSNVILILVIFLVGIVSGIAFATAGSETDPLVTIGYVEKRIEQIKFYVDEKINGAGQASNELLVEKIEAGQELIGESGTEIILRSGEAVALVSDQGGLCDMTDGKDLGKGAKIPNNHMLIIPRSDGRGLLAKTEVYVMIRGKYTIEKKGAN